jgi:hypothetical protein
MNFAFLVDGNKWHVKSGTVIYSNGFLNGLEVDGEDMSQSFGPHGMSTSFTFLGTTRLKEGKLIGDIYGMTYNDGQLMTDVLVAEGVEIASEENYDVDESVVKHGRRSGLPSSPSKNDRLCDGSVQEQDARASDSLSGSRDQRNVRGHDVGSGLDGGGGTSDPMTCESVARSCVHSLSRGPVPRQPAQQRE